MHGPFIGPVVIRGGGIKKNIFLFSLPIENPAISCSFFFSQKIKDAVNWMVKPCQDPLNHARIGYIHMKRYFRARNV